MPASITIRTTIASLLKLDTDEWVASGKSLGDLEAIIKCYNDKAPVDVLSAVSDDYSNIRLVHSGNHINAVPNDILVGFNTVTHRFELGIGF